MPQSKNSICSRIAQIRMELAGPRGKSSFAKQLGISASTYDYYESSRVPPAEILVKIADVAGVDLRWLLTGQAAAVSLPSSHPIIRRAAQMLGDRPEVAAPLAAFLDVLAGAMQFPAKEQASVTSGGSQGQDAPATHGRDAHATTHAGLADPRAAWIPVLARSAAGVPAFWADESESGGTTALADLLEQHLRCPQRRVEDAKTVGDGGGGGTAFPGCAGTGWKACSTRAGPGTGAADAAGPDVQIITLDTPGEDLVAQYVSAPAIKARYGDAFALRIDGDSMSPEVRHGDLVILSPGRAAVDGQVAVVQLRRQIGVTCKVYRRQGQWVHLTALNAKYAPQTFDAADVRWALGVLGAGPAGLAGQCKMKNAK